LKTRLENVECESDLDSTRLDSKPCLATTDGIKDEVDRPLLDDVEVVFGEVAKYDENQFFGTLVDEDGFFVDVDSIPLKSKLWRKISDLTKSTSSLNSTIDLCCFTHRQHHRWI